MKRYQVAILSFALGIFAAASIGVYWFNKIGSTISVIGTTPTPIEHPILKIYFSNNKKDPQLLYCDKTYPVERTVSRLSNNTESGFAEYTYLVISKLLDGPTVNEKDEGYLTSINEGTKVQKLIIKDGVATVDFNDKLNEGVARLARLAGALAKRAEASGVAQAGSCKVQAIRSQIEQTLRQFPEIKKVVISVNGESEEILQP